MVIQAKNNNGQYEQYRQYGLLYGLPGQKKSLFHHGHYVHSIHRVHHRGKGFHSMNPGNNTLLLPHGGYRKLKGIQIGRLASEFTQQGGFTEKSYHTRIRERLKHSFHTGISRGNC